MRPYPTLDDEAPEDFIDGPVVAARPATVTVRCAACGEEGTFDTEAAAREAGWLHYWLTAWACKSACFEAMATREDMR